MAGLGDELLLLRAATGVTDQSSEGNDGTYVGGMGVSSGEFEYDGTDDRISVGRPVSLRLEAGPISISMFFTDDTGTNSLITMGVSRGSVSERTFDIFDTGSQLRFHGLHLSGVSWALDTTTRPALGDRHHVVATWDGTTDAGAAKLYVDGALAVSGTPSTASLTTGEEWNVGGIEQHGFAFDGQQDDIRIFGRAVSAAEVTLLYNSGTPGYDAASGAPAQNAQHNNMRNIRMAP